MKDIQKDYKKYLRSEGLSNAPVSKYKKMLYNNQSMLGMSDELSNHNIFDKLLNERILFIGDIDDDYTELTKASLLYLDFIGDEDITLYINSGGGSVYSGLGLLDVMDYIKSDIVTVNTGLAASMGAVILCGGTTGKRKALKRSRTMIHQPLAFGSWAQQASDMEIEAKEMNLIKKELYEIISERSGQTFDKVNIDGDRDYWMSSKDALKYGMIDEIIKR